MHHPLTRERLAVVLRLLDVPDPTAVVAAVGLGGEHAPVTRLTFDRSVGATGATSVVVKTRRVDGAGWGGPHHLRREVAALTCTAVADHPATPRVLAVDEPAGVVVLSDLGPSPTLEDVLLGADAGAARAALVDVARDLGRLHAATVGVEDEHRQILGELGTDARRDRLGLWPGVDAWEAVAEASRSLGFADAAAVTDEVEEVRRAMEEPGAFGALVHLDLNPTNVLVTPDGARFVDFEGSTFGHLGMDLCFLHYPFPNYSAHWSLLPADVVGAMGQAHRDALGRHLDRETMASYDSMLAFGAAAVLAVRVRRLPVLAMADQQPGESWRRRAQLVQQIDVFTHLAEAAGVLPRLAGWFADLRDQMCDRWPDASTPPPPTFPAFGAGGQVRSASPSA